MKVLLYSGSKDLIKKSGIGKALEHQAKALKVAGIPMTTDVSADYDIVQINTVFLGSYFLSLLSRMRHKKVVYYAHSTMEDFRDSFVGSNFIAPYFKKWISHCYNTGDVIITPTPYSKSLLDNYDEIKKPILNLSNGVDTAFYKGDGKNRKRFRSKYNIKDKDKVIVSVGHLIERKGIIDFIDLARELPQYKFYWFGSTPKSVMTQDVKDAIANKTDNLFFPGYVSAEDLRDAYLGSDLFLFLSHEETEGIVVLEALSAKIPTLIRDIPVYDKWLQDGINVYKAEKKDEFKEIITKILQKKLTNLTEMGYKLAMERDLKNIGNRLKKIYSLADI